MRSQSGNRPPKKSLSQSRKHVTPAKPLTSSDPRKTPGGHLTEEGIKYIQQRRASGATHQEVANELGVSITTVFKTSAGKRKGQSDTRELKPKGVASGVSKRTSSGTFKSLPVSWDGDVVAALRDVFKKRLPPAAEMVEIPFPCSPKWTAVIAHFGKVSTLAEFLGVAEDTVTQWAKGVEVDRYSCWVVRAIADALGKERPV